MKEVYGATKPRTTPLLSADGSTLLKEKSSFSARWRDHFSTLLNRPSTVGPTVLDQIQQKPMITSLDVPSPPSSPTPLPPPPPIPLLPNCSTIDMIFSVCQVQERCIEQNMDLFAVFIDLTKAFDTVNREALWVILSKLECPTKFVNLICQFQDVMTGQVLSDGEASEPFSISNGVKQGCVLSPVLFNLFFACVLDHACHLGHWTGSVPMISARRLPVRPSPTDSQNLSSYLIYPVVWLTTVDLTASFLHSLRFSAFHSSIFHSRPLHSLMLPSHHLICLPLRLPP